MAKKKQARPNQLLDKVIAGTTARARKNIQSWRNALRQAENTESPRRTLYYDLCDELELDAHLFAEMQRRILAVRGCEFSLIGNKGVAEPEKTALLKRPWFYDLIDLAMQSIFYGHSLVQIGDLKQGEITGVELIKRKHVIPEKGLFVFEQGEDKGVLYREDLSYAPFLIEIGKNDDLGLFNKCAPHVLYKRFAQSAWSEFCEIFGMPVRVGKTNTRDTESLNRMENMLINMATANYAVIDKDDILEFVETAKSNGEVYKGLIDLSNAEISKLINSAVIGGEGEGGSRSKEEVGERLGQQIYDADKQWFEGLINYTVIPKLVDLGYQIDGFTFKFEKAKDINKLWEMTKGALEHYEVDEDFIRETFNIPITGKKKIETNPNKLNAGGFFD